MPRWVYALPLAFAALTGVAHGSLTETRAAFPEEEDLLYLPPARHLQVMSVGYDEALADLIWIRAVVFAGTQLGREHYEWVHNYLEVITALVPTFRRPYAWGGVVVIYNGKPISKDMLDTAQKIYRAGLERFPEDHELLFALGMILVRDVKPDYGYTEAEESAAKAEGAELIRKAAAFGAPPLIRQLAATLVTEGGGDELTLQFLDSQLLATDDEDYQRLLRKKIQELSGKRKFDETVRLRDAFWRERDSVFPYLPDPLYALIRDEAQPSVPAPSDEGRSAAASP